MPWNDDPAGDPADGKAQLSSWSESDDESEPNASLPAGIASIERRGVGSASSGKWKKRDREESDRDSVSACGAENEVGFVRYVCPPNQAWRNRHVLQVFFYFSKRDCTNVVRVVSVVSLLPFLLLCTRSKQIQTAAQEYRRPCSRRHVVIYKLSLSLLLYISSFTLSSFTLSSRGG